MFYLYRFIIALFFIALPFQAMAEDMPEFSHIFIPDICTAEAKSSLAAYKNAIEYAESPNRYNERTIIDTALQKHLIQNGSAVTYPRRFEDTDFINMLYDLETRARDNKNGCMWSGLPFIQQAQNIKKRDTFMIIEGRVLDVHETRKNTYLNFGTDWKTDFTVRIENKIKSFKTYDLKALQDKKIRVRGFVSDYNGPSLTLSHPVFIESISHNE